MERRQPDRTGSEGSGELLSRRFGCRETCESVLLNTLRYRHNHRLLVVDALDPCDGAAPVSTCRARRCLSRRSSVRRSWMGLLARPSYCHAAGSQWTWVRLCRSSVQLSRPATRRCDGAASVSTCLARHCRGQRLSVVRRLWSFKSTVSLHPRRLMYAACRLAVVAPTRLH